MEKDYEIKKISDYIWEVPKKGSMKVPVRIYASEKLLKKIKEDGSIEQGINVATLPGIQGKSIMLADAHRGYGASIGGVAGIDAENGFISPGMTGFDINCIHPEAKVSTKFGTYLEIKELEKNWENTDVQFFDLITKSPGKTNMLLFMKKLEDHLYNIKTKNGRILRVTKEHPVLTQDGMKKAENLTENDKLVLSPFKGVKYEEPGDGRVIARKDIERVLDKIGVTSKGNSKKQILNYLQKRDLLELRYNSPKLPILIKLMGFIFGDGVLGLGKDKISQARFYANQEDLEKIKGDLKSIGINCSNIYKRLRNHEIKTNYGVSRFKYMEMSVGSNSKSFAVLLATLGVPVGRKTHKKYRIPGWLMKAPLWQKRLFLASLFGAELSKPKTLNKYNFYESQLNMNKSEGLKQNGIDFLNDIRKLLLEFGINSNEPVFVQGNNYNGVNGKTIGLRLSINNSNESAIRFYESIGYEYNIKKQRLACLAVSYLKLKEGVNDIRKETREQARLLYNSGVNHKEIKEILCGNYINERFIERSIWESTKEIPRIALSFLSFEDYCRQYAIGDYGLVYEEVESIEKIPYNGYVYDFTINDKNHNFIADNFVVSNCGVRLLTTNLEHDQVEEKIQPLLDSLFKDVPAGVGGKSIFKLTKEELDEVLNKGVDWAVEKGYATKEDKEHCEEFGRLEKTDASKVSDKAKDRGKHQFGTLGAGNHFLEIQTIDEIYDKKLAETFGIKKKGLVVVMIHTGSRGLGHQTCSDYLRRIEKEHPDIMAKLPDKDLAYAKIGTQTADDYFKAMCAAANFAWTNRQLITYQIRKSFKEIFPKSELKLVYDVCHNIVKEEEYEINGKKKRLFIHRKGATRAFGPGREEVPKDYRSVGQPIIIPGSMGTASYVLIGTENAREETFGSTVHGAGRNLSRHKALKEFRGEKIRDDLEKRHIYLRAKSWKGVAEEAPLAYKDIDEVVKVSHEVGIGNLVVRLVPLACIKG